MVCERLAKRVKRRMALLVGLLFSNGGMFLSYFSVQMSPHLLNLTLGLVTGIGSGLIYAIEELYIVEWTDKYIGLATSSVQSVLTLATMFSNLMVTLYINPENIQPNTFNGHVHYFAQKDIITRVPSFFLLLGGVSLMLNGVGFFLVRDRPSYYTYSESMPLDFKEKDGNARTVETIIPSNCCIKRDDPEKSQGGSQKKNDESSSDKATSEVERDCCLSPRQALKTPAFWVLALTNVASDSSFINMTTYYKAFGSLYIKDDHFLTIIGTMLCVSVAIMITVCGVLSDKLGVKITTIFFSCLMTIMIAFFYFTPLINRWLFLLISLLSCGFVFGVYNLIMVGTLQIFGVQHFTTIYGMVALSSLLVNILVPPVTELIIVHCGWVDMYLMVAIINFLTLLLIVKGLPRV